MATVDYWFSFLNLPLAPMSFYGKAFSRPSIELDANATSASSSEFRKRLDRIESNYSRLDVLLCQLEAQFDLDVCRMANAVDAVQQSNVLPKHPK